MRGPSFDPHGFFVKSLQLSEICVVFEITFEIFLMDC